MKNLFRIYMNYKSKVIKVIVMAVLLAALRLFTSLMYKDIVEMLVQNDYEKSLILVGVLFLVLIGASNLKYFSYKSSLFLNASINKNFKQKIGMKITSISEKSFKKYDSGHYESLLVNNMDRINDFYANSFGYVYNPILFIGASIIAICFSPYLFLVTLGVILIGFLINALVQKNVSDVYKQDHDNRIANQNRINDTINGYMTIQTYLAQEKLLKNYHNVLDNLNSSNHAIVKKEVTNTTIQSIVRTMTSLIITFFGGYLAYKSIISFGEYAAYLSIISYFFMPVEQMIQYTLVLKQAKGAMHSIKELFETEELEEIQLFKTNNTSLPLVMENAILQYNENYILKDASLRIYKNDIAVIKGESGIGKTTLLKAINAKKRLSRGTLEVFGNVIEKDKNYNMSNLISNMDQVRYIFNISILENIRLFNPEISIERVVESCKKTMIHDFIMTLENGYDTVIKHNGDALSGGQKQRICLARALCSLTPILLLDEPTSEIDEDMRIQVIKNIVADKDRTILIVSHNEELFSLASKLVSIENKHIITKGMI